jgi:hypothetical protein
VSNCNPDYNFWYVGARTQWNPVKDFALGVDVNYIKVETAFAGTANLASGIGARPSTAHYLRKMFGMPIRFEIWIDPGVNHK